MLNPNHFLAVAIGYLYAHRPEWPAEAAVGKTLVSSSMIDRVAADLGRALLEVPVGFKWFVPGLLEGTLGFGGEESAGASFLRRDGSVWTTDKDGLLLATPEEKAILGKLSPDAVRATPPARPLPRTCTRSTPSPSAARSIRPRSRPRPGRWWPPRWPAERPR